MSREYSYENSFKHSPKAFIFRHAGLDKPAPAGSKPGASRTSMLKKPGFRLESTPLLGGAGMTNL
jgi:hypothetical protein